jgi:hypothetical protein
MNDDTTIEHVKTLSVPQAGKQYCPTLLDSARHRAWTDCAGHGWQLAAAWAARHQSRFIRLGTHTQQSRYITEICSPQLSDGCELLWAALPRLMLLCSDATKTCPRLTAGRE